MVSVPPRRSNSLCLDDAQQLDLGREIEVADLVQEQRAPLGQLEASLLARLRACKRALFVAEQLRFDQSLGQRGAADLDKGLLGPRRVVVNGVGDQLLPGARLSPDQHGGVGPGHLGDLLVDLPHAAAVADHVREVIALAQFLAQVDVLLDQALGLGLDQALEP